MSSSAPAPASDALIWEFLESEPYARVKIFAADDGYSRRVKGELRKAGIPFALQRVDAANAKDSDEDGDAEDGDAERALRDALAALTGSRIIPSVFVDGEYFGDANKVCRSLHDGSFPVEGAADASSEDTSASAAREGVEGGAKIPLPSLEEYLGMSDADKEALVGRVSKSGLKKLEKGARVHRRKKNKKLKEQELLLQEQLAAAEAEAVALGEAQRAAAGLAPDGAATAAIEETVAAEAARAASVLDAMESKMEQPAHVELIKSAHGPLLGQDKWLGGMASPCGRYVYGVPGTAKRVLQIEVATGAVEEIGPSYDGQFKWLRGVDVPPAVMGREKYPCGACFALPSNASSVLKVDPATKEVTTFGGPFEGDWLWHGGALTADGYAQLHVLL